MFLELDHLSHGGDATPKRVNFLQQGRVDRFGSECDGAGVLSLLIAAQLSAPAPVPAGLLFTPDDVPIHALTEDVLYVVRYALEVTPQGRVQGCRVVRTSGNGWLDTFTCNLAAKRAKFRPAIGSSGGPAHGLYLTFTSWWVGSTRTAMKPSAPPPPDLELVVKELPHGVLTPHLIRTLIEVGVNGQITACEPYPPQPSGPLVSTACAELKSALKPDLLMSRGTHVTYVREALVRYVTQ